jgi:hypothetical protein
MVLHTKVRRQAMTFLKNFYSSTYCNKLNAIAEMAIHETFKALKSCKPKLPTTEQ